MTETRLSEDWLQLIPRGLPVNYERQVEMARELLDLRAKVEELEADYKGALKDADEYLDEIGAQRKRFEAENRQPREALKRYSIHDGETPGYRGWCASLNDTDRQGVVTRDGDPCDCGLSAALGEKP